MEQAWINEWNETRTGPLTSIGVNMIFWFRIPEDSPLWDEYTNPASGKNTPHVEVGFDGGSFNPTPRSTIANAIIPLQPESRTSRRFSSRSPALTKCRRVDHARLLVSLRQPAHRLCVLRLPPRPPNRHRRHPVRPPLLYHFQRVRGV
jgi:hypothetical protein